MGRDETSQAGSCQGMRRCLGLVIVSLITWSAGCGDAEPEGPPALGVGRAPSPGAGAGPGAPPPALTSTVAPPATPAVSLPEAREGDTIYAVAFHNDGLVAIDPRKGAARTVGNFTQRLGNVEDLVLDPANPNQAIAVFWEGYPGLMTVDLATGRGTMGPKITGRGITDKTFVEGIAFVDGVLYGSASGTGSYCPDCSDRLVRIDPRTGDATVVGKFGPDVLNVEAIAYSPKHGLIGADIGTLRNIGNDQKPEFKEIHTQPCLVRIDPRTGRATKIGDLPPPITKLVPNPNNDWISVDGPFVAALSFDPEDNLYGATIPTHFGGLSELVVLDPRTAKILDSKLLNEMNVDGILYVRKGAK